MKLKLLKNGPEVIDRSILADTFPTFFTFCQDYEIINESDEEPDYHAVAELFSEVVTKGGNLTEYDSELAIALHKMLPLTRYEASRVEFWHHLAIDYCADYVQLRWDHTKDFPSRYHQPMVTKWHRKALVVGRADETGWRRSLSSDGIDQ